MPSVAEIMTTLIKKHGGNKSAIAEKLKNTGIKGVQKISSQRLGQYESGKMEPKTNFYKAWKTVFNEDIEAMVETNVSRETTQDNRDPWIAVHKLVDAFKLTSKGHHEEVKDLRKDKESLRRDKEFLEKLLLKFSGPDTPAHKT